MKLRIIAGAVLSIMLSQAYAADATPATTGGVDLTSDQAKLSYTIGVDMGQNFRKQAIGIDPNVLSQGIKDGMSGANPQLTQQQMQDTLLNFQKQLIAKREAQMKQLSIQNKMEGDTFLAKNKAAAGVVTLPSGLQYKIITKGNGTAPGDKDLVTVDYKGQFINGQVFDQSSKPVTFAVGDVIPGWTEALKLMTPGSTWEIYIPPTLAYGENGVMGGPIGPNQTLVFNVHLISVKPAKA